MVSAIDLANVMATMFVWGLGIAVVFAVVMWVLGGIFAIFAPQPKAPAAKLVLYAPMPWERYVWWGISAAVGGVVAAFVLIAVMG